jgi:hypothetical protein
MGFEAAPFKVHGQPIGAGAYLYFGGVNNLYPIIMSYYNLINFGNNDQADRLIVQPGYKLVTYVNNYSGTASTYDNTDGLNSQLIDFTANNVVSSCKLYYLGTELSGNLSQTSYTNLSPVASSDAPTTGLNKVVPYTLKNSTTPAFCPIYMTGWEGSYPIFHSIPDFTLYGMNDSDDRYLIAPHFTIIVYNNANYSTTANKFENATDEWQLFTVSSSWDDTGSSCKVYYYGTEITNT